jgi:lipooligosaccharide transport system ATP-binding protein
VFGLDDQSPGSEIRARHLLWERLYRIKQDGATLVLTTHYMDEAEQLCDRLVIMDEGRIVAEGSPRSLIERYSTREVVELRYATPDDQDAAIERLPALVEGNGAERIEPLADRVLVYTDHGDATVAKLTDAGVAGSPAAGSAAAGSGGGSGGATVDTALAVGPESVLVRRSSLEDVFLRLTGRSLEEG